MDIRDIQEVAMEQPATKHSQWRLQQFIRTRPVSQSGNCWRKVMATEVSEWIIRSAADSVCHHGK